MTRLDGKGALVTGAGRGIGRAEALALGAEGATVVVNDVDGDEAAAVVDEIRAAGARPWSTPPTWPTGPGGSGRRGGGRDVGSHRHPGQQRRGAARRHELHHVRGAVDEVIRPTSRGTRPRPTSRAPSAGPVQAGGAAASRGGRIINTASESGLYGLAGQGNYAAAKAGIASLTVVLGRELRKYGVTVNAIAPRARTRMTETVLGDMLPEEGRFDDWDPANIAPVVVWLAGDDAGDISGQVFVVTGDKVHLMTGWSRVGRIDNKGRRWSVEDLAARRAELFGDRSPALPVTGFGE
ncbi:MAG: SDR family NAD(P)-dependent oxidoreductase [Acidimicrobiales bacterium]